MSDVRVVLKDQGVVKSALLHKETLNAFYDPRWYGEGPLSHPLLNLFGDASVAPEDAPYGTVAIDRDSRWVGSCQGYMSLEAMEVSAGRYRVEQYQALDLDAKLSCLDSSEPYLWGELLSKKPAMIYLFSKAFAAGFITHLRTENLGNGSAWVSLKDHLLLPDAQSALDWVENHRQKTINERARYPRCAFRFDPPGWTIRDYDINDEIQAFEQAMIERGWGN